MFNGIEGKTNESSFRIAQISSACMKFHFNNLIKYLLQSKTLTVAKRHQINLAIHRWCTLNVFAVLRK